MMQRTLWLLAAANTVLAIALAICIRELRSEHATSVSINTAAHQVLCEQRAAVDQLTSVNGKLAKLGKD